MLDSLKWLGEQLARQKPEMFLDDKIKPIKKGKQLLVKVVFDLDEKKVSADHVLLTESLAREYLWVGNTLRASREPVARLTTDDPKYLANQKNNLVSNMRKMIDKFRGLTPPKSVEDLDGKLAAVEDVFIKGNENFSKMLNEAIGTLKDEAGLYTVCLKQEGAITELAKTDGYRDFLILVLTVSNPERLRKGICHVCGREGHVLMDPSFESGTLLKVYVCDKKGFAPQVTDSDESWMRSFAVCIDCRKHLTWAWSYIQSKLVAHNVGGVNAYIIPRLLTPTSVEQLDKLTEFLKKTYSAVASFESLERFEEEFKEYAQTFHEVEWYSLTVVYGAREQASFDLKMQVQDVPITRFVTLANARRKYEKFAGEFFGGEGWSLGFEGIYRIFPLASEKRKPKELGPFLELVGAMLSQHMYSLEQLLTCGVLFARIHRHRSYAGFNIAEPSRKTDGDIEMCKGLIKYALLIGMLQEVGVMGKGVVENLLSGEFEKCLRDDLRVWFGKVGFNEVQRGLFALGYLIGEVGAAQKRKGDERKAILNKIDFHGMSLEKVMELSIEILKSLRDYRLLTSENEVLYHFMKASLDSHLNMLAGNPIENVYYILSGYAFNTYKHISRVGGARNEH